MSRVFLPRCGNPYGKVYQRSNVKPKQKMGRFKSFLKRFSLPALAMAVLGALGYALRDNYLLRNHFQDANSSSPCTEQNETIRTLREEITSAQEAKRDSAASQSECSLELDETKEQLRTTQEDLVDKGEEAHGFRGEFEQCMEIKNTCLNDRSLLGGRHEQCNRELTEAKNSTTKSEAKLETCISKLKRACNGDFGEVSSSDAICNLLDPMPKRLNNAEFFKNTCYRQKDVCINDLESVLSGGEPKDSPHYKNMKQRHEKCQEDQKRAAEFDFGKNTDHTNVCRNSMPFAGLVSGIYLDQMKECVQKLANCKNPSSETLVQNQPEISKFSELKDATEQCEKEKETICTLGRFQKEDEFNRICNENPDLKSLRLFIDKPKSQLEACQKEIEQCETN